MGHADLSVVHIFSMQHAAREVPVSHQIEHSLEGPLQHLGTHLALTVAHEERFGIRQ